MARRSKIIAGLKDAVRYARGERTRGTSYVVKVPPPLDVRAIRQREGLSQKAFAAKYGIQGLKEALAYSRGDKSVGKSRIVRVADRLNVRVIRDRLGMTQKESRSATASRWAPCRTGSRAGAGRTGRTAYS
jgi:hypothetical protein